MIANFVTNVLILVLGLFVSLFSIMIVATIISSRRGKRVFNDARSKIKPLVETHLATLIRRRRTLILVDEYGTVDSKRWNIEVQRFIDNVIRPTLSKDESNAIRAGGKLNNFFHSEIEDRIREAADLSSEPSFSATMSPTEYETFCANVLQRHGWNAATTKASSDQGADVVAEKGGIRVILQCKLYSSPVGNKAVQEALAAMRHLNAQHAVVVSNADFTRSARELSNTTGVILLNHVRLSEIDLLIAA